MTTAAPFQQIELNRLPPSRGTVKLASVVVMVSILFFLCAVPFVQAPLMAVPAFIPAYEAGLVFVELITATLLLAQYSRTSSRRMLVLASGYLFNTGMILMHALSFPGVFGPAGIIGGDSQTPVWIYSFWHLGFPLFVLAFSLIPDAAPPSVSEKSKTRNIIFALAASALLVAGIALLCTRGHDLLPILFENGNYALVVTKGVSPAMLVFCLLAIAALVHRSSRSALDVWMIVVVALWMLEVLMSAVFSTSRYDLGWYGGRIFGLCAGTFILVVLLWEANSLYQSLSRAVAAAAQSERELQRSREELSHAQRLEAIGQLTGGIAHDFNNVLQVVSASLSLLRFRHRGNADADALVERAMGSVASGARLATELLAFARRQPLRPQVVNLAALLASVTDVVRRTIGDIIAVRTVQEPGLWNTLVDPSLLENALLNLALNARDAMPSGGTLSVSAHNVRPGEFDFTQHPGLNEGEYVMIAIRDTGTGMPADVLARVFEPFFTTKPLREGTGLGLSIVHGFAKQSAGHISVASEIGQGTTFSLFLQRSTGIAEAAPVSASGQASGGAESILVVEDHPEVRRLAVETLKGFGYAVTEAHDAESAVALLESGRHFDLLFSDVMMPGRVKTTTMAHKARQLLPDIVILYTSGYIESVIGQMGTLDRDVHLLSKPYTSASLASKIRDMLGPQT